MIGSIESILKNEEKAVLALRSLYRSYGYLPFKMSKFEEYDLYVRNKDFLISDGIITFNDTNGKLLALKPDVTPLDRKERRGQNGLQAKALLRRERLPNLRQHTPLQGADAGGT